MRTLELDGRRVLVIGLGVSGRSAARFCAERGAAVVAVDERPASALGDLDELGAAVEVRCAATLPLPDDEAGTFDLVVPSPGVPHARYANVTAPAWGDVELLSRALPDAVRIAAITGTNGKSTTTCLVEAMLRTGGLRARAAGNLGDPALGLVGAPIDVAVLEVSSFQLDTTEAFRPDVAVVLNVTPDHLDRHATLEGYAAAKARILANQTPDDTAVLAVDDPIVAKLAASARARVLAYSRTRPQSAGAWLDGDSVVLVDPARGVRARVDLSPLGLEGRHNRDNAAMALCAAVALGVDPARASRAFATFRGLPHRSELVAVVRGVRFVDDSKATNPGAAERSLEGCEGRVVWIAGGRDKGLDFAPLAEVAAPRVRAALWIGESAGALEAAMGGAIPSEACGTLARAVARAAELAREGDTVLLAPACASFDQLTSYAHRGEVFRREVLALAGAAPGAAVADGRDAP
ncbi:MAG: UDP-N-acetylmuramoyl-L-alanine--D-glutamate ligase [Myxococcales bacterium]|nr:UDP-N-acetylmuramoyl-L-alanine--D-glutamate ligase [Myxococcales bacterium]